MSQLDINTIFKVLELETAKYEDAVVDKIAKEEKSPFKILISTLISSRTKDEVTAEASERLFSKADTPVDMLKLKVSQIQELIYPAGFYKNKGKFILETSKLLIDEYDGEVPDSIEDLVKLPGVGRKTANLVLGLAFNIPAICVDTHVHRITNRWGYIETKTPELSEKALMEKLPLKFWIPINNLLVTYGKNVCTPISPYCSTCVISKHCKKMGVNKSR